MMFSKKVNRYGVFPVATQAGKAPSPRTGSPKATSGGNLGTDMEEELSKPIRFLQWNAEGIGNKKMTLAKRLKDEDIDVACIQETHLKHHPKHGSRFTMRGYQVYREDRSVQQKEEW